MASSAAHAVLWDEWPFCICQVLHFLYISPQPHFDLEPDYITRKPIKHRFQLYTVSQKNVLTLKRYSSKLQGVILMKFGRNIQNTLE